MIMHTTNTYIAIATTNITSTIITVRRGIE